MAALTIITPNRRITLPQGEFIYQGPVGNDRHHLVSAASGQAIILPDHELIRCYAENGVTIGTRRNPNRHDQAGGLEPDEVLLPLEMARAWFCREYDKAPTSLSTRALDEFVRRNAAKAKAAGVTHLPSAGALRRALDARGEPHQRPSKVFRTLRGKVPRTPHFPAFVENVMDRVVAWYWSAHGRQKGEAYALAARLIAIANRLGGGRYGEAWRKLPTPSDETIRARINKAERRVTWAAKYGERPAAQRFLGTGPGLYAKEVLEKVVIDATVADGWCVWRGDTLLPLGRPTLYIAVDVHSRQIVNWFVSFEPPSLYGVMALLKRIVTPNDDDVWGKPDEIIVDNGWENVSPSFQEACVSAGISINWAPVRTPEYKAVVERAFGTINSLVFKKLLGGAVVAPPTVMRSLGLDPKKTANLSLEQLDDLLAYAIREVYANRSHGGTMRAPQLLWERGTQRGRYIVDDLPNLVAHFGQVEECTLKRSGIVTKDGLRFYDRDAVTRLLDAMGATTPIRGRPRGSATVRVKVVVNPEDLSQCMVWDARNSRPVFLSNLHTEFGKEVSSRWEYRQLKAYAKAEDLEFKSGEDRIRALASLRAKIEAMAPDLRAAAMKRRRKLMAAESKDVPEGRTILHAKAPASHDGLLPPTSDVRALPAAEIREDERLPKGVRRGGKAALEKQKRTMRARRQEQEPEQVEHAPMSQRLLTEPAPKIDADGVVDLAAIRSQSWRTNDD